MTVQDKAPWHSARRPGHSIHINTLPMGAESPVRIQSMANTATANVEASVEQAKEIIAAGGELVRFTVIHEKDAHALKDIKAALVAEDLHTPLVADVHFNARLADIAATYVDKVRINPGNYIDKRATFQQVDFSDAAYAQELQRLEERFTAFLQLCREERTAVRIGTNHGSLSDRIMSRYGDTPAGMVEATLEFLRICQKVDFKDVVVSLKSSNTRVMVEAYRLLHRAMQKEGMDFCLHLGVTEAGNATDGRVKSAVGIGTLLQQGLGDTIRVSLTEHPAKEIPVARHLVRHFETKWQAPAIRYSQAVQQEGTGYQRRASRPHFMLGNGQVPVVMSDISDLGEMDAELLLQLGFEKDTEKQAFVRSDRTPDILYTGENICPYRLPDDCLVVMDGRHWDPSYQAYPLFAWEEYFLDPLHKSDSLNFVQVKLQDLDDAFFALAEADETMVLVAYSMHPNATAELLALFNELKRRNCQLPVIVQQNYKSLGTEDFILESAADNGIFFIDGLADGLWLKHIFKESHKAVSDVAFNILQASRSRTTRTEYISCPGCGRTLFDLEETLERVKAGTQHLRGLKIAVMGCIVNGPGEMADADYGYVGAGAGKVNLYKGKELLKRNIDSAKAVEELLAIIEGLPQEEW